MAKKKTNKKNKRKIVRPKKSKSPVKKPMRSKKKAVKKTAKFLRSKNIVETEKPILLPAKLEKPLEQRAIMPSIKNEPIRARRNYISRHIVDLRKIKVEKSRQSDIQNNYAHQITEEVFDKITNKKTQFSKNIKEAYSDIKARVEFNPNILPSKPAVKVARKSISLPKLNLPSLDLPHGTFNFSPAWAKAALSFIIVCLILVSPLFAFDQYQDLLTKKNSVLGKTASALTHLSLSGEAASAHDLYYTQFELQAASENFTAAEKELQDINLIIESALKITDSQYNTATKLLYAGEKLSASAATFSAALNKFNLNSDSLKTINLTDKLAELEDSLNLILPNLTAAENDLNEIDIGEVPAVYQEKIKMLQDILPSVENNITSFINYSDLALKILGQDSLKRYLLLFQNNNELRPTGGFIGSYALLDLDRGNIKKISIPGGGPYDLKAGLKVNISAPKPLRILNQRWEFQDANWFADLPVSADKLNWFYEKSGGPTIDGLIFINASFVENLLKITGPIEMPDYGKTISAENFIDEIQKSVEFEYDKTANRPKQIIADLAPKLLDKLMQSDKNTLIKILDLAFNGLSEKDIQLYFKNFSLEKFVLKNNWGGEIKKTDRDYLNIISTNIAGEKTDAKISVNANLKVDVQNDGSIINTLTLVKTHSGQKGEALYGVPNIDYLRVYTPKGSEFISANGFEPMETELFDNIDPEIFQADEELVSISDTKQIEPLTQTEIYYEGDKSVFANWIKIEPGETKTVTLSYKLPFKLSLDKLQANNHNILAILKNQLNFNGDENNLEKYSLLLQKQSGRNYQIDVSINFPKTLEYTTIYPENLAENQNSFNYSDILNVDKFLAIIFKKS